MTITYEEFIEQIATLYAYGLPQKDEWEFVYWYRTIKSENLTKVVVEEAVLEMTKVHTKFWDTDNVPAMIIQTAISLEDKKKAIATKNHFLLADKREQDEDKKLLASWGGTEEEAEANREKTRELIRGVFK
jgi:hypothetical protein|tara:strand:- start:649 stop:1041 length:393 start_codon:yes stop_codon:yes gene_type:complete